MLQRMSMSNKLHAEASPQVLRLQVSFVYISIAFFSSENEDHYKTIIYDKFGEVYKRAISIVPWRHDQDLSYLSH